MTSCCTQAYLVPRRVIPGVSAGVQDGMGVTIDSHATDPSQKFKAFGTGTPPEGAGGHGVWSSADGLHWTAFKSLAWSKTTGGIQRYDDHQQPLWDAPSNQYEP